MAAASPAVPPPEPEQGTVMPVWARATPAGRPAKATSAPITTAALSTDFLAFIDPLPSRRLRDPDHKPYAGQHKCHRPLIRPGHNRAGSHRPSKAGHVSKDKTKRGVPRHRSIDLTSYQKDGKGCTAIDGKVERAGAVFRKMHRYAQGYVPISATC